MSISDKQLAAYLALPPFLRLLCESPDETNEAAYAITALVAEVRRLRTELAIAQEQAGCDRAEAAEAEVARLRELREKDAVTVLALHEAAGGNKGLSSADLLDYTRLAMKRVRSEVRREALEEAAQAAEAVKAPASIGSHRRHHEAGAQAAARAIRALIEKEDAANDGA